VFPIAKTKRSLQSVDKDSRMVVSGIDLLFTAGKANVTCVIIIIIKERVCGKLGAQNTGRFKKTDSILNGYISWSIYRMWMIYITFERGGPKVWNTTDRELVWCTAVQQRQMWTKWPPRSPDLTPCDYFLWGFVKEAVYVWPLPTTSVDLKTRIRTAVNSVTQDILLRVWDELSYRLDVIRAAGGGHTEHL
jgi:hypothetical protein